MWAKLAKTFSTDILQAGVFVVGVFAVGVFAGSEVHGSGVVGCFVVDVPEEAEESVEDVYDLAGEGFILVDDPEVVVVANAVEEAAVRDIYVRERGCTSLKSGHDERQCKNKGKNNGAGSHGCGCMFKG